MPFRLPMPCLRGACPFLFSSGHDDGMIGGRDPGVLECDKPLDMLALVRALHTLVGKTSFGSARLRYVKADRTNRRDNGAPSKQELGRGQRF